LTALRSQPSECSCTDLSSYLELAAKPIWLFATFVVYMQTADTAEAARRCGGVRQPSAPTVTIRGKGPLAIFGLLPD
jgi:hypothetical protein